MITRRFASLGELAIRLQESKWIQTMHQMFCEYFGIKTEFETVILEGNYYSIVKNYYFFGEHYLMLICETDPSDMFFRKQIIENGVEYLTGLNDKAEFDRFLSTYVEDIESIWKEWWDDAPQLSLLFKK